MKVTTRVLERPQLDNPLKRNSLAGGGHRQLLSPFLTVEDKQGTHEQLSQKKICCG